MAVITENASYATEFAGNYKVVVIDCDGASGSNTVAVDELSLVVGAVTALKVAPTAACAFYQAAPATNSNVVTVTGYKSDFASTATQTLTDFYLICIGY